MPRKGPIKDKGLDKISIAPKHSQVTKLALFSSNSIVAIDIWPLWGSEPFQQNCEMELPRRAGNIS